MLVDNSAFRLSLKQSLHISSGLQCELLISALFKRVSAAEGIQPVSVVASGSENSISTLCRIGLVVSLPQGCSEGIVRILPLFTCSQIFKFFILAYCDCGQNISLSLFVLLSTLVGLSERFQVLFIVAIRPSGSKKPVSECLLHP